MPNPFDQQDPIENNPSLDMNLRNDENNEQVSATVEPQEEVAEHNEVLEEAKKYGYKTKEELEAEGKQVKRVKSPEEFVKYGREWNQLEAIRAENAKIKAALDQSLEYQRKQAENAVKQAKLELEVELQSAKLRGDVVAVEQLAQQKAAFDVQKQHSDAQTQAQQKAVEEAEANSRFINNNSHWFNDSNPQLKQRAVQLAQEVFLKYPTMSYMDAATMVENQMYRDYPETRPIVNQPPTTISSSRSNLNKASLGASGSEDRSLKSLTPEQRSEYERVRNIMTNPEVKKAYTVEKYLEAFNKYQR